MSGSAHLALEQRLGWTFADPGRLCEALTHSTYANENPDSGPCNERLEFLGDAVVGLLTAEILHDQLTAAPEGVLTRRRARVVRRAALADRARALDLGRFLRLGHGQQDKPVGESVLANAYEALVGAVFVDGGYEAARRCFGRAMAEAIEAATDPIDFKTQLQELCHRRGAPPPSYRVVRVSGPDHARRYACEVVVSGAALGAGEAQNKKEAEQLCAQQALQRLGADDE
jgi:ribonuclease-3